jgi:hypothetical protein
MEVGVDAGDLDGLVPHEGVDAERGLPVELDEAAAALGVDEAEGVDAEAVHHAQAAGDAAVGHDPQEHVDGLGGEPDEVVEGVVGRGGLGDLVVGFGLHGVDQVGELDRVLDEEDGDVVADEVEDAVLGVELDGEAAGVAGGVGGAARAGDGGEADEHGGLLAGLAEELGGAELGERLVDLEVAVGGGAAGVHGSFGDPLVVEVGDLFAEDEVLEQGRAARAGAERVVVVADRDALIGGQVALGLRTVGLEVSVLALGRHAPGQ